MLQRLGALAMSYLHLRLVAVGFAGTTAAGRVRVLGNTWWGGGGGGGGGGALVLLAIRGTPPPPPPDSSGLAALVPLFPFTEASLAVSSTCAPSGGRGATDATASGCVRCRD